MLVETTEQFGYLYQAFGYRNRTFGNTHRYIVIATKIIVVCGKWFVGITNNDVYLNTYSMRLRYVSTYDVMLK